MLTDKNDLWLVRLSIDQITTTTHSWILINPMERTDVLWLAQIILSGYEEYDRMEEMKNDWIPWLQSFVENAKSKK